MDQINSSIQPNFERLNANGELIKTLIIKQFQQEYWNEIELIKLNQNIKSTADAVRWALKRANGKL